MDIEKDIDRIKEGFIGESIVREYLNKLPFCDYTQIDIMAKINKKWYSIEVKHQEMFKAPPFDGHGLPVWQVRKRLMLYNEKGIIPLIFVLDKNTNVLMYNSIVNLESKRKFTTKKSNRIIYPIENFIKIEY